MEIETQLSASARPQLDRFCRQYLQLQLKLDYPDAERLRNDVFQQCLYGKLFKEDVILHGPPQRYQLKVLKELTKRIERSIQDWEEEGISDDLMNSLSFLISFHVASEVEDAQQKSFVTYTLSCLSPSSKSKDLPTITLHESRNLVAAAGTTGNRTWEAALHLGNYLCCHAPDLVLGKSILELGAGTGYVSILCSKHLGASHVLATDGSDEVVSGLSINFYLNGLQDQKAIEGKELRWGHALMGSEHPQWNGGRQIDLVLGADLSYDGSAIPALVSTFGELFDLYSEVKIIIAATVRNPTTFQRFLTTCRGNKYAVEEIGFGMLKADAQEGPFYSDEFPVQLCMITNM